MYHPSHSRGQRFCSYSCRSKAHVRGHELHARETNPNWRGGKSSHPLYDVYLQMVARCTKPTHKRYADYGGRGITVCEQWLGRDGFWQYVADVGERPDDGQRWTVDRVNNDGAYTPGNVRWATYREQRHNRRDTIGAFT